VTDPADVIARCPECGTLFAVPAHEDVTNELAEIAKLAGALDFHRDFDCPECRKVVHVRPGERVEVSDDDVIERAIPVVGDEGTRRLRRVRLTVVQWRELDGSP
jgi:hypothetical protein